MSTAKELLEALERGEAIGFFEGESWVPATGGELRVRVDPTRS